MATVNRYENAKAFLYKIIAEKAKRREVMRKRITILCTVLLLALSALTLIACNPEGDTDRVSDGGKVYNIYCWNDEFQSRFRAYFPDYKKTLENGDDVLVDGTVVKWTIVDNKDNKYQNALDEALKNQTTVDADERIDLFLVEADYALKYVDSDYTLDVKKEVGLEDEDLNQQYAYTQTIVTDADGNMKGTSWQATPGLFAYRRDIAIEVLGTDDPVEVQKKLSDWTKFEEVAKLMKDKGYTMLSGYDDAYRVFSNNMTGKWVNANEQIVIDPAITQWITQTKNFTDKGYNNKTSLWDDTWAADQGPSGKTFGFFYSTWGINFTLEGYSLEDATAAHEVGNGTFGEWAVTEGPASFYWGGTWICGAANTDNVSLTRRIMYHLTCNEKIMKQITLDTQDYTNNKKAMNEIANDPDFGSAFLGGQNHIKLFTTAAEKIDMSNITYYDQGLNESLQTAMKDYFAGTITLDQAWNNFYTLIKEKYPSLTKAA